jgi:hypothetical protein
MTDRVQLVSLAEQIGAVDRARRIVGGGARVPSRAAERDYDVQALAAALRTLQWVRRHEAEIRSAVAPKQPNDTPAAGAARASEQEAMPREEKAKPREFPLARRAAMRCAEGAFQKFLGVDTPEGAADALRRRCDVASRKDFDRDAAARERWRALEAEFGAWLRCAGEADRSAAP